MLPSPYPASPPTRRLVEDLWRVDVNRLARVGAHQARVHGLLIQVEARVDHWRFGDHRLMRAAEDAGFAPGITSGFRDDYRQSIASGQKAASDRSFHGGSRRGGYGYG